MRGFWQGRLCAAVVAGAAISGVCAPASMAASAASSSGTLTFRAAAGEANDLTISNAVVGGMAAFKLADRGAPITPGPGCVAAGPGAVTCQAPGISSIVAWGFDRNDRLVNDTAMASSLYGGDGDDEVTGGAGRDRIAGGRGADVLSGRGGDDQIVTRGNYSDVVSCGAGVDGVWADRLDGISPDCESVFGDRVPLPPPPTTTPAPAAPQPPPASTGTCQMRLLRIPHPRKATVTGAGRVKLAVARRLHGWIRFRLSAVRHRLARVTFKLDGRRLKSSGRRSLTRRVRLRSLRSGRHILSVTVTPRNAKARTLRLVIRVNGC